ILRFGPPGARMNGQDGIVGIVLAAEQRGELEAVDRGAQGTRFLLHFRKSRDVFRRQIRQFEEIGHVLLEVTYLLELGAQGCDLTRDPACGIRILPKPRPLHLPFQIVEPDAPAWKVKGASRCWPRALDTLRVCAEAR